MKVTLGKEGCSKTWQDDFPETTACRRCGGLSRIAFVAHEGMTPEDDGQQSVASLHQNGGRGDYWLHDYCAVAVYFCRDCLEPTAHYNQG
jgi:hypothetical protein